MNSPKPYLIIVTGRPAAGKSTLAKWLSKELKLPVVSKDSIRELLFDQLGWKDREWAKLLGRVSIDLMFYFAQAQLETGHSITMDNAFHPEPSTPDFWNSKSEPEQKLFKSYATLIARYCFKDSRNELRVGIAIQDIGIQRFKMNYGKA